MTRQAGPGVPSARRGITGRPGGRGCRCPQPVKVAARTLWGRADVEALLDSLACNDDAPSGVSAIGAVLAPEAAPDVESDVACPACGGHTIEFLGVCTECGTTLPDFAMAREFLCCLDAAASPLFTFQAFDDTAEKRTVLAQVIHSTVEQHVLDRLARLNARGAGVLVTVNQTNGNGRKTDDVLRVRALFVDIDGTPLEPVREAPLRPHLIVEPNPGHYHGYWLVADCPLSVLEWHQHALARRLYGDSAVCDLPRVMRLPGLQHRKGVPFTTRLLREHAHDGARYAIAQLVVGLGLHSEARATPMSGQGAPAPALADRAPVLDRVDAGVVADARDAAAWLAARRHRAGTIRAARQREHLRRCRRGGNGTPSGVARETESCSYEQLGTTGLLWSALEGVLAEAVGFERLSEQSAARRSASGPRI